MDFSIPGIDAGFSKEDFRGDFKQIIAKRSDLVKYMGGRLKIPLALSVLYAGQALGVVTATGRYAPYDNAAVDGTQTLVGFLSRTTQYDQNDNGSEIAVIISAELLKDKLIGLDAPGIADLSARTYVENGVNILVF